MTIDPLTYPTIWETICACANSRTVLSLRATCTTLRDMVDASLLTHLCAKGPPYYQHRYGEDTPRPVPRNRSSFERGFFLSPREDGLVRIRVPPATSTRGSVIRRRCRVIDIDRTLADGDCRWIARLASPHTLRVLSPSPIDESVLLGWATGFLNSSGRIPAIIDARRVVLGPTPALGVCLEQAQNRTIQINRDALFERPVTVSDATRRLVLHLYAFADRRFYVDIVPGRLRELVLAIRPAPQQVDKPRESHGGVEGCITWYLEKLVGKFPKVSITVVGLDEVFDRVPERVLALATDSVKRMELRTKEEHRAALGWGQWSVEMEI